MEPYALAWGEGRTYEMYGNFFTFKAGSNETGLAFIEYTTRKGEEPETHTHNGEDEIFFVLDGELEFSCGGKTLRAGPRGFVFLPRDVPHNFRILSEGDVRLLVVTAPPVWAEFLEAEARPTSTLAVTERQRRKPGTS